MSKLLGNCELNGSYLCQICYPYMYDTPRKLISYVLRYSYMSPRYFCLKQKVFNSGHAVINLSLNYRCCYDAKLVSNEESFILLKISYD